jgi:hypothetical protein
VPTIGIFGGSDPALTGLHAPNARNVGAAGRAADVAEVLALAR